MRDAYLGGCGRRSPIRNRHGFRVGGAGLPPASSRSQKGRPCLSQGSPSLLGRGGARPRARGACGLHDNLPSAPPIPVLPIKMGVARSTRGNLTAPPHNLLPGEATGLEAKRGPACELPPGVTGAVWWAAWWGMAPGTFRVWGGASILRGDPQGARRPRTPPLQPRGCFLARGPALGGGCAG